MQRLVLALLILAIAALCGYMLLRGARDLWPPREQGKTGRMTANETLNKLAFALLVALILYVSVWGG